MSLPVAIAVAATSASQHGSHSGPVWTFVFVLGAFAMIDLVLGHALAWISRFLPGKWQDRFYKAAIVMLYPLTYAETDNAASIKYARHARNLFAVRRKTYLGKTVVILNHDDTVIHAAVGTTRWEKGDIIATLAAPFASDWWFKINVLVDQGGQLRGDNFMIFTADRWAVVEPQLRAAAQKDQGAALSEEVSAALAVLGLPHTATMDELIRARNGLLRTHHPDRGGSTAAAQRVNDAFALLRRKRLAA